MSDDALDMLCDESWPAIGKLLADTLAPVGEPPSMNDEPAASENER